jgi:hypothetical protein
MSNQFDMKCPECGSAEEIDVAATVWVRLTPDGTDADAAGGGDHEWDDDTSALCGMCHYEGKVRDFQGKEGQKREADYIVTVQLFACAGDDIHVMAVDDADAERKAQNIAQERFDAGDYSFDLNEICISCTERKVA